MKRTSTSITCDSCNKEIESESDVIQVYVETHHRVKKGELCSHTCAIKWFDRAVRNVLGWCDSIGNDVDNLTTDQWGGAGPDCRTEPV